MQHDPHKIIAMEHRALRLEKAAVVQVLGALRLYRATVKALLESDEKLSIKTLRALEQGIDEAEAQLTLE